MLSRLGLLVSWLRFVDSLCLLKDVCVWIDFLDLGLLGWVGTVRKVDLMQ